MKNVDVKRRWRVRMGNDPSNVVELEPGEQQLDDALADRAIRAGVAEAKKGRPKSKKETAATAPPETTAIGRGETETKR